MHAEPTTEEIVHHITYSPRQRKKYFLSLPLATRSVVIRKLSHHVRNKLIESLPISTTIEVLDHLDARDIQYILDHISQPRRRSYIASRLKNERFLKIDQFITFHPQATSSIVHTNFILADKNQTIIKTAEDIETYIKRSGRVPELLVQENGALVGEVPIATLVRERNTNKLAPYAKHIHTIPYAAPKEQILDCLAHQPHTKVAVLDTDGSVLGLVYSDDIIALIDRAPAASLYSFAGVEETERPFDSTLAKVRHRYKWLILNLGTAFLAAGTVSLFEDTLTQVVMLAIYMPIIAGMGSNAATQTLAVMVRGIATGEISLKTSKRALVQEVQAGLINGLITGTIVTLIALIFNQNLLLGVVAGAAVVASLILAGFFGTIIPLVLRAFGKDPATSATIFITTGLDILGFFIFFGLATLLLI